MKNTILFALSILRRWPTVVAILIILVACAIKWSAALMPENASIPPIPALKVNAKTYFAQAYSQLDPATDRVVLPYTPASQIGPKNYYHQFTQTQIGEIVKHDEPAFVTLEHGLQYPYLDDSVRSYSALWPYLSDDRAIARALRVAAENRASKGDYVGAMNYCLDAVQLGTLIPHGSPLIGMLVGVAIDSIGRRDASNYVDHLSASESLSAANRLVSIDNKRDEPFQSLVYEKQFTQASLLQVFRDRKWTDELAGDGAQGNDEQNNNLTWQVRDFIKRLQLRLESPRTVYDNYTRAMDENIEIAKLPWPAQVGRPSAPTPSDPIIQILFPIFTGAQFRAYEAMTGDRILELELALHAYQLGHGSYPTSLNQLVPTILKQLPTDPFSDSQLFKYHRTQTNYLLYSVGPDGVDNGGKPVYDSSPYRKARPYFLYDEAEKGDIVARVNEL